MKKVILYNTSIGAILKGNEQYLVKLRYVLGTFRSRDDVVLWWRPHPLGESTYNAMRPQLMDEYKQVVEDYKREGWGIYDDTPDLHRAIACTDAYYGDWSSLVALYQATGKPILVQNPNIVSDELSIPLSGMHITDEYIWYSVRYINAFFRMRRSDGEVELLGSFPGEAEVTGIFDPLYMMCAENNGTLYFAPFLAKEIATYSLRDNTFGKIPFENRIDGKEMSKAFIGVVSYGKYVFFTPGSYPAILRLNIETRELNYYSDWVEPLEKLTANTQALFFSHVPLAINNMLWLASDSTNAVLAFDMENCRSVIYTVGTKGYGFYEQAYDGQYFWLLSRNNNHSPLLKWSPQVGIHREFPEFYKYFNSDHSAFSINYCLGYLWLFPMWGNQTIRISIKTDTDILLEVYEEDCVGDPKYVPLQLKGEYIFAFHTQKNTIIQHNCQTKEQAEGVIKYSQETRAQLKNRIYKVTATAKNATDGTVSSAVNHENSVARLLDFVMNVSSQCICRSTSPTNVPYESGKTSTQIYQAVKRIIRKW